MGVTLTIAPDFKALCPALTEEELRLLEESIVDEGCREPVAVWKCNKQTIIVDGHNRYTICSRKGIPYKLRYLEFECRQEALGWAARNQLGRRNVTEQQKSYLRGQLYRQQKTSQGGDRKSKCQNETLIDKAAEIAEETGVSKSKVHRDAVFSEAVDALAERSETLKDAALRGDIPKSAVAALAEAPKAQLRKLEKLEPKELRKATRGQNDLGRCPNCKGDKWDKDEDGVSCSRCHHPHGEPADPTELKKATRRAARKPGDEQSDADMAKAQIKIWYDAIGRWLGSSPSIDEYRAKWPGPKGDRVVKLATEFYEALKLWQATVK